MIHFIYRTEKKNHTYDTEKKIQENYSKLKESSMNVEIENAER